MSLLFHLFLPAPGQRINLMERNSPGVKITNRLEHQHLFPYLNYFLIFFSDARCIFVQMWVVNLLAWTLKFIPNITTYCTPTVNLKFNCVISLILLVVRFFECCKLTIASETYFDVRWIGMKQIVMLFR